jgi:thiamine-phosphate pyrophosphorylase
MTAPRLYIDFRLASDATAGAMKTFRSALDAAPVACALLRPLDREAPDGAVVRNLIREGQDRAVAMLIAPGIGDVARLGADGVHLPWSPDTLPAFKSQRQAMAGLIVGADAGRSRHDAMELGEAGADYVAFGIPPHVEDRTKALQRQIDLIAWWSDVIELPCVAFDVPDPTAAARLVEAGADFIAVGVSGSDAEQDAAARVRDFASALSAKEPAR